MRQATPKKIGLTHKIKKKNVKNKKIKPQYGTSKLEERFKKDFLEKLCVEYVYQFEAKDIGRFYDFYLPNQNLLIEIDGDYYHSYGLTYEQMSPMQKKNRRVDNSKDKWAILHGIPIMRIWEHDINDNPKSVMESLIDRIKLQNENIEKLENKKKRH